MLTKFYMTPDFFSSDCFSSDISKSCHKNFLELWQKYGVLVFCEEKFRDLPLLVSSMDQKYRKQWEAAFQYYSRKCVAKDMLVDSEDFEKLKNSNGKHYSTRFVGDAEGIIVCGENMTKHDSSSMYEVVSASVFSESVNFENSKGLALQDISGCSINYFWESYLSVAAEISNRIVIVDPYFIKNIIDGGAKVVLVDLLNKLGVTGDKYIFEIYSRFEVDGISYESAIRKFANDISKRSPLYGLSKLSFYGCKIELFSSGAIAHDRYIRVGDYVFQIGVGMKLFESNTDCETSFSVKCKDQSKCVAKERKLKSNRKWTVEI